MCLLFLVSGLTGAADPAFESRTVELARVAALLTVLVRHRQGSRIVGSFLFVNAMRASHGLVADKLQVMSYVERFLASDLLLHPKQSQVYLSSALNLLSSFWKLELEGQCLIFSP